MQLSKLKGFSVRYNTCFAQPAHNARMPDTGPSFIEYLSLHHRHEIEHLRAHNFDNIALPGLQVWCVAHQKQQDILLWFLWKLWRFARTHLAFLLSLFRLFIQAPEVVVLA